MIIWNNSNKIATIHPMLTFGDESTSKSTSDPAVRRPAVLIAAKNVGTMRLARPPANTDSTRSLGAANRESNIATDAMKNPRSAPATAASVMYTDAREG
jgi:hypothetical protein